MSTPTDAVDEQPCISGWLSGAAVAAVLTVNVDAESTLLARDPTLAGNEMLMSHQSFGPLVAVPRILRLLGDVGVSATFFVSGLVAARHPAIVAQILEAGHEIGHHSHAGGPLVDLSEAEEEEDFCRGLETLRAVGAKIAGHRAPFASASVRTAAIAARSGLLYESTLMDDDQPYRLDTGHGEIIELPSSLHLSDWLQYVYLPLPETFRIKPVAEVTTAWRLELESVHAENGLFLLTLHASALGRVSRLEGLRELIANARQFGDVRFFTARELAVEAAKDSSLSVRPFTALRPEVDPSLYPTR